MQAEMAGAGNGRRSESGDAMGGRTEDVPVVGDIVGFAGVKIERD